MSAIVDCGEMWPEYVYGYVIYRMARARVPSRVAAQIDIGTEQDVG